MILEKISILNYKNIREASLQLSPKINCFVGSNGMGKTNALDAVYYLSFCHSSSNPVDSQIIRHGEEFFMLEGIYRPTPSPTNGLDSIAIACAMKRGQKKHFKRDKKEYKRLSEHIGLIPAILISPNDTQLIDGGSEERRRLMDTVISQTDRQYMDALNRYNKALQQRNTLLKQEDPQPDPDVLSIWEEQMATAGEEIFKRRSALVEALMPAFQSFYQCISGGHEELSLRYISHCQRGPLLEVIQRDRWKDMAVGYSLHGVHRDDLEIMLDGHPMRREGSQGQLKTFVIALKLAQFSVLSGTPILLLDDIFDKLDAKRVEQIVKIVAGEDFGQIFITDTNRDHLDQILAASSHDYKIFHVEEGDIHV